MQIAIDIDKELYEEVKGYHELTECELAIFNGKVLEPHGRLGDLDALEQEMINGINAGNFIEGYEKYSNINNMDDCVETVRYAPTILEAWGNVESEEQTE